MSDEGKVTLSSKYSGGGRPMVRAECGCELIVGSMSATINGLGIEVHVRTFCEKHAAELADVQSIQAVGKDRMQT